MPVLLSLLVVAMLVIAIVELAVLLAVGDAIGVLPTIALLILAALIGVALLRREGGRTLLAIGEALRTRRPPHRELLDGMLIAVAAGLIVLPGLVSDLLGLLLLLPPTRALIRRRILRSVDRASAEWGSAGWYRPGTVIEGEILDDPSAPRPGRRDGRAAPE